MAASDGSLVVRRILEDDSVILRAQGELDMATLPKLREALSKEDHPPPSKVVIDFADLSFIDVTGIRGLVAAHRQAEASGRSLRVVNPTKWILKVFELTSTTYLLAPEAAGDGAKGLPGGDGPRG